MAASGLRKAAAASTSVKPIFSRDLNEAKRRVRELYRAWYREVPNTGELQGCIQGPGGTCPRSLGRAEVTDLGQNRLLGFGDGAGGGVSHKSEVPPHRTEPPSALVALVAFAHVFLRAPGRGEQRLRDELTSAVQS